METLPPGTRLSTVVSRTRSQICLHAKQRLYARIASLAVKLHRPEHIPVIGDGNGPHPFRATVGNESVDPCRTVQQREIRMVMKVDECTTFALSHCLRL